MSSCSPVVGGWSSRRGWRARGRRSPSCVPRRTRSGSSLSARKITLPEILAGLRRPSAGELHLGRVARRDLVLSRCRRARTVAERARGPRGRPWAARTAPAPPGAGGDPRSGRPCRGGPSPGGWVLPGDDDPAQYRRWPRRRAGGAPRRRAGLCARSGWARAGPPPRGLARANQDRGPLQPRPRRGGGDLRPRRDPRQRQASLSGAARRSPRRRGEVPVAGGRPPAVGAASWVSSVEEFGPGELEFSAADPGEVEAHLAGLLAACGSRLVSISPVRPSLEDVILSLTVAPVDAGAEAR